MDREKIYKIIKNIYKSENIFNQDVLNERIMFFNSKVKEIFTMFKNVEERMRNIEEIFDLISKYLGVSEVEKKQNGEVFTPFSLINEMLDQLPVEVWSNPNLKWLDPANGIGNFPAVIIQRLMIGLEGFEPDPELRYKHILEKMIYVCDISPKNMFLYLNIFDPEHKYEMNYHRGSFLEEGFDNLGWGEFDIIVGNFPYQESIKGSSDKPLYNLFIEKSLNISDTLLSVHPNKWMSGGKGLGSFRDKMKKIKIKILKTFNNLETKNLFNNTQIEGGVQYFLIEKKYNGLTNFNNVLTDVNSFDIIIEPKYHNIVTKIINFGLDNLEVITRGQSYCGILTNDKRLVNTQLDNNYIKTYVSKQKGYIKYIDIKSLDIHSIDNFNGYKVFTAEANGGKKMFGNKFIAEPNEVCTQSYIGLMVNNKKEAENLITYMGTNFCNFFLGLRKISQHISPSTLRWIPKIPLDREWTDQQLYEYFELTEDEIKLVEETVK